MYCIVRHVQEERFVFFNGTFNVCIRFYGECIGEEGVRAMVFFQSRNGPVFTFLTQKTVSILTVITARLAEGVTGDIDIKPEVDGISATAPLGPKWALPA